jgi:hypothetical protein
MCYERQGRRDILSRCSSPESLQKQLVGQERLLTFVAHVSCVPCAAEGAFYLPVV